MWVKTGPLLLGLFSANADLVLLSVVQSSGEAGVLRFDVTVQEGKTQYFTLMLLRCFRPAPIPLK